MTTQTHAEIQAPMTDAELAQHLETFEADMSSDSKPFNAEYMWQVATDPANTHVTGDAFTVLCAIASLTKHPALGCRASHATIARRASSLKRMFRLAEQVGWDRIIAMIKQTETVQ